jgi:hypothetical protein
MVFPTYASELVFMVSEPNHILDPIYYPWLHRHRSSTPTGQAIPEKVNKGNHALWKMHVLAVIRGVGLESYLTRRIAALAP